MVNPAKLTGPTPSKPGTHNGMKQVIPTVFPTQQTGQTGPKPKPSVQATPMVKPTPSKPGTHNGVKQNIPTVQTPIPIPVNPPKATATPVSAPKAIDINHRLQKGRLEEIIEPGIRNKEVESYRTNDKKEIEYKDVIKQDNKGSMRTTEHNVTKHY